jgi:hypothetical protein
MAGNKGIWAGSWQPGRFDDATAVRSKGKLTITLSGELPREGYSVELVQEGPRQFRFQWRGGGCIVKDILASFDQTWEFSGNYRGVKTIEIITADGTQTVNVKGK